MRSYVDLKADLTSDDPLAEARNEARLKVIQELASKWNAIQERIERRYHDAQESIQEYLESCYDEAHYWACREDASPEDAKKQAEAAVAEAKAKINEDHDKMVLELEAVEQILAELDARMARPYEHWNEEEKLMEYLENRYDNQP